MNLRRKCNIVREILKNSNAITLISLVITIIVMVIIAGIGVYFLNNISGMFF